MTRVPTDHARLSPAGLAPISQPASPDRINDAWLARTVSHEKYVRSGIGLQRTGFAAGLQPQETPNIGQSGLMTITQFSDDVPVV
jgi:hypothetical protein